MPTGDAVDYKWYQYTADDASTWSVKVDKLWGENADSGFSAFNAADPVMANYPGLHPRKIHLQDAATGRVVSRVVGSAAATSWTTAGYGSTAKFRGLAGTVVVTKFNQTAEKIRRAKAIINKAEPSTA